MTKRNTAIRQHAPNPETHDPALSPAQAHLERHQRLCTICHHPDLEFIEQQFLHWHSPDALAREYDVHKRAIFRHAHALGLFERRRRNLRFVFESFLERVQYVAPTGNDILRAARAYARVNDLGQWIDPPTTHFVVASAAPPGIPGSLQELPPLPAQLDAPAASQSSSPSGEVALEAAGAPDAGTDPVAGQILSSEHPDSNRHSIRVENAVTP
ncbi:MAG TPA: hypothetical protein VEG64_13675 [Candidatus Sulfotelmatobacter sp.]|nr:hypothetical protein [Candidatus Sulfotelmatobacter sp.]